MGRKVNVSEVIGKSKLNGFMYGVIAIGVIMILFDGYDMASGPALLPPCARIRESRM